MLTILQEKTVLIGEALLIFESFIQGTTSSLRS